MEEEVKYCKNCKRDISAKNYVIHTVHCERNIQLCDRCAEPVPRSELEKHEEEFHSKDACSECGILVEKCLIEKHKEICDKKLIPCEYCKLEVHLDKLSQHGDECGSRTELCPKCNKYVTIKDLNEHIKSCSRKEPEAVPCEYCDLLINWNEMLQHSIRCGTRTEICFQCNEHVMLRDREVHLVICRKNTSANKVPCEYCKLKVPLDTLFEHTAACGDKTERCSKCNNYVMLKDLKKHHGNCLKKEVNLNEEITCDYCRESFSNSNIGRHVEFCKSQAVKCKECSKYIQRKDMEFHLSVCKQKQSRPEYPCKYCRKLFPSHHLKNHAEICEARPEKCNYCDQNIPFKNLEAHLFTCKENREFRPKRTGRCKHCGKLFPDSLLEDHTELCQSRNQKCEKCDKFIPLKDIEKHSDTCKRERQLKLEFQCQYCGKFIQSDFRKGHAETCKGQSQKCEKCDKFVPLKDMVTHSSVCKDSFSKTYGVCPVCHQSIPWVDMNVHSAHCAQINSEVDDYERQNQLNELTLKKEPNTSANKISAEKKILFHKDRNRCSFCFELFPQHLQVCEKRPYSCDICLKAMPYQKKEEHKGRCLQQQAYKNEPNTSANKISAEKKILFHKDKKRCSFCFELFPQPDFPQHLQVCEERPYSCDMCLKAMPYQKKEEHKGRCLQQQAHENDYTLHDEEVSDSKKLKKLKKCNFCEKRMPDILFQQHLKDCEQREEKCAVCFRNVPVKDMQDHKLFKCNFGNHAETKNFNNHKGTYAEAIPKPSKNLDRMEYLEEIVEICPSCGCKIPEERYTEHLVLCYNDETQCHFCGTRILKKNEHSHFQSCPKILKIVEQDKKPQNKKKQEKSNKGNLFTGIMSSIWSHASKEKSIERTNTRLASQESYSWQEYRSKSYDRDNKTSVYPSMTGFNEVNELPCEFCNQMWPSELLIEHESGCRPDLVSFPKTNEGERDDEKYATASAKVSTNSPKLVLDASFKSTSEDDDEWKVKCRRSNQASNRENANYERKERNQPQKQLNGKERFFYYPSQDSDEVSKNQPGNLKKKRYPQVGESQGNLKTDNKTGVKKDDPKKEEFSSFRFSSFRFNEESKNASDSRKEIYGASTDVGNYDERKNNSFDLQKLSAESSPMVNSNNFSFKKEIKAVGAERTEKKRLFLGKDTDVNMDFEKISLQESTAFDENKGSQCSKLLETTEDRTVNLNMPAIWNTEHTLSSDKTLRSHLLKSFDKELEDDALSISAENLDPRAFDSSTQEIDYDAKNNETFGGSVYESINDDQKDENENDAKSEISNSDDTFYDADDGSAKYFDIVNDNFQGRNNTLDEKLTHCDFDNTKQRANVNFSDHEYINADIKQEEEDLNQKDNNLDGYFQFLQNKRKQSHEATWRSIDEVEKHSCRITGICKCVDKECNCELSSLGLNASTPQACSLKDSSFNKSHTEPMDIEPLGAEAKFSNQMKSKINKMFNSKEKVDYENSGVDEAKKWREWRKSEPKVVFSSDSE